MCKIIVIEGMDGTGKETQSKKLYEKLSEVLSSKHIYRMSFPMYGHTSSVLVDAYLHGRIKEDPMEVNPYAAASTYALDRYISYEREWKTWVEDKDAVIIMDRYVTSSVIHQSNKLEGEARIEFAKWLYDYEYEKLGLPKPDIELYLSVTPEANKYMLHKRKLLDIHETETYQNSCRRCFDSLRDTVLKDLVIIKCNKSDDTLYSVNDIHNDILFEIQPLFRD